MFLLCQNVRRIHGRREVFFILYLPFVLEVWVPWHKWMTSLWKLNLGFLCPCEFCHGLTPFNAFEFVSVVVDQLTKMVHFVPCTSIGMILNLFLWIRFQASNTRKQNLGCLVVVPMFLCVAQQNNPAVLNMWPCIKISHIQV